MSLRLPVRMHMYVLSFVCVFILHCHAKADTDPELECLERWQGMSRVFYMDHSCYIVPDNTTDWQTAKESCAQMGTQLALITDKEQMNKIANTAITDGVWIALLRESCTEFNDSCLATQPLEGWSYIKDNGTIGVKSEFHLWAPGQPVAGMGDAAILTNDGLENSNRSLSKEYICQQPDLPSDKGHFKEGKKKSKPRVLSELNLVQVSIHDCGTECYQMASCKTYAFDYSTNVCYLYWLPSDALELESSNNFKIMDKLVAHHPSYYCPMLTDENAELAFSVSVQYGRMPKGSQVAVKCKWDAQSVANATCLAPHWSTLIQCSPAPQLLLFGGIDAQSSIELFHLSDPTKNQEETSTMVPGRYGHAAGLIGNKVMIAGGYDQDNGVKLKSATIYDPATKTFTPVPDMSIDHFNAASAIFEGFFHICGGGGSLKICEKYTGGVWETITQMTTDRVYHCMAVLNGKLYAIGGGNNVDSMEMYDSGSQTWQMSAAAMPAPTPYGSAATIGGHIYKCGGYDGLVEGNYCFKYSDVTDDWSQVTSMNMQRQQFHLLEIGNKLLAVGGSGTQSGPSLEIYDPDADAWTLLQASLIHRRKSFAVVVLK